MLVLVAQYLFEPGSELPITPEARELGVRTVLRLRLEPRPSQTRSQRRRQRTKSRRLRRRVSVGPVRSPRRDLGKWSQLDSELN